MYRRSSYHVMLAIASLSLMVTGIQCSLKNPVAPSWETDINIPLVKNNTYISDFLGFKSDDKDFSIPVILGTACVAGQVNKVDISAIKGVIVNGSLSYDLENRLAIGLDTAIIFISRDSGTVYQAPEITIGPLQVEAAETDSCGNVIQTKTTRIDIVLGEKEMQVLENDRGIVFVGYHLATNGTNGHIVNIRSADYLKTTVMASVRARVN